MSIERDLIQPGITQRGGRWALFSSSSPGYAAALRATLGPTAEINIFERDRRAVEHVRQSLGADGDSPKGQVRQGDVTQMHALSELDGVVAANVLHEVELDRQQQALSLLVGYLRTGGCLLFIEAERRRGNLRVRYPVDYESFEYFAGLIGLRDVRRVAVVPTGWWSTAYAALGFRAHDRGDGR